MSKSTPPSPREIEQIAYLSLGKALNARIREYMDLNEDVNVRQLADITDLINETVDVFRAVSERHALYGSGPFSEKT